MCVTSKQSNTTLQDLRVNAGNWPNGFVPQVSPCLFRLMQLLQTKLHIKRLELYNGCTPEQLQFICVRQPILSHSPKTQDNHSVESLEVDADDLEKVLGVVLQKNSTLKSLNLRSLSAFSSVRMNMEAFASGLAVYALAEF